jgi:hypothetical protein
MRARKHYVPAFTRTDKDGRQQAVCGAFVGPAFQARVDEDVHCWGCQLWLEQVERPAATLAQQEETVGGR